MQIKDFQRVIRDIYFDRDCRRGADRTFLWFLEEVGELTRAYRRNEPNTGEEMADVVAWLVSTANLLGIDLEAEINRKYPGKCPLCSGVPCQCPPK